MFVSVGFKREGGEGNGVAAINDGDDDDGMLFFLM